MRFARLAAFAGLLATPTQAFEPLNTYLAGVPFDINQTAVIWSYTHPSDGFPAAIEAGRYLDVGEAWFYALSKPEAPRALTGIDFGKVTGVFQTGEPPNTVTVLQGPTGFASDAAYALAGRGFEASTESGLTAYAFGEDFKIDMARRDRDDPFGSGLGRSQRIGVGDTFVISAAAWQPFRTFAAALEKPESCSNGCDLWRAAVNAVEAAAPHSELTAANALTLATFMAPLRVEREKPGTMGAQVMPPIGLVVVATTQTDDASSLHLTLLYQNAKEAELGAAIVAERLRGRLSAAEMPMDRPAIAELRTSLTPTLFDSTLATISLDFEETASAQADYRNVMRAIMGRDFYPLAFFMQ